MNLQSMRIKNILFLGLLLFSSIHSKISAADLIWYNGKYAVSYNVQKKVSPVVREAVNMFASDMEAKTGHKATARNNGIIDIYQMDMMSNKEFKNLETYHISYQNFIAKPDAFYLGVRNGRIVIVGSNAIGTAYGILELSRMAGISPWIDVTKAMPKKVRYLAIDKSFQTTQWPSVTYRGIALLPNGKETLKIEDYQKMFRLLVRLRGNCIMANNRSEERLICSKSFRKIADNYGIQTLDYQSSKHPVFVNLGYISERENDINVSSVQPGVVYEQLQNAIDTHDTKMWITRCHLPKVASYDLSLIMDMAWNSQYVNAQNLEAHYKNWLTQLFGDLVARKLLPLMSDYYRLIGICKPELLAHADFNESEFGNELERYIAAYQDLSRRIESIDRLVDSDNKIAYFATIKYPVIAAAATTEMNLEAQEARNIARPGLFYKDEEALAAAANSLKAYQRLKEINDPLGIKSVEPILPGKLTDKQVKQYATTNQYDLQPLRKQLGNCIALNAISYASGPAEITTIPMLGHSNNAVVLHQNDVLEYTFNTRQEGIHAIRIATIPNVTNQIQIRVDFGNWETIYIDPSKKDFVRGQVISTINKDLYVGSHHIYIKAASNRVILDQIMFDHDPSRIFYVIPVTSY